MRNRGGNGGSSTGTVAKYVGGDKLIIPFADGAAHEPIEKQGIAA
ncbi:hypothetical protein AB6G26_22455 [Providencia hangzhouensis]